MTERASVYASPASEVQSRLASIWAEVLSKPAVASGDNFFDLGGESLAAVQIVARASELVGRSVPFEALFRSPTLEAFSDELKALCCESGQQPDTICHRRIGGVELPLTFNQERRLVADECLRVGHQDPPVFNLSFCLRFDGPLNAEALDRAVQELVSRHELLRSSFERTPGTAEERYSKLVRFARSGQFSDLYRYRVAPSAHVEVRRVSLEAIDPLEQWSHLEACARRELAIPLCYETPPAIRPTLVRLREDAHVLLIVIPHLISDATSLTVLKKEIVALYSAYVADESVDVTRQGCQFSDFSLRERQYLDSPRAAIAADYWTDQWERYGDARLRRSDIDSDVTDHRSGEGYVHWLSFDRDQVIAIRRNARDRKVTLFMLCVTTLFLALRRLAAGARLAIWVNCANRERPEFRSVLGWFASSHLLGVEFAERATTTALLAQVQAGILGALTHQAFPTGRLWQLLGYVPTVQDEVRVVCDFQRSTDQWAGQATVGPVAIRDAQLDLRLRAILSGIYATVHDGGESLALGFAWNRSACSFEVGRRILDEWFSFTKGFDSIAEEERAPQWLLARHAVVRSADETPS